MMNKTNLVYQIFLTIILISVMAMIVFMMIPSLVNASHPPYNPCDTVLLNTKDLYRVRAMGVTVDGVTGDITVQSYYNWEQKDGWAYNWVKHEGMFVFKSGEALITPNTLDECKK
jgi:hypothetical protein